MVDLWGHLDPNGDCADKLCQARVHSLYSSHVRALARSVVTFRLVAVVVSDGEGCPLPHRFYNGVDKEEVHQSQEEMKPQHTCSYSSTFSCVMS